MVYLVPMSDEAFERYRQHAVRDYAQMQVKAGLWRSVDAMKRSEQEFERLLPEGPGTKDHFVFSVEEVKNGETVGVAWLAVVSKNGTREAFVFDIEINETFRNLGYGGRTMRLLEDKARDMGLKMIRLRVHAYNSRAHDLYLKLGYEDTDFLMARRIDDGQSGDV